MRKTGRKNKTHQKISYTNDIFTIEDLNELNPTYCNITLRVHLNKAIETGEVITIGFLQNGKGRPKMVMAHAPLLKLHLESAKKKGVLLSKDLIVNIEKVSEEDDTVLYKKENHSEKSQDNIISREEIIQRVNAILS